MAYTDEFAVSSPKIMNAGGSASALETLTVIKHVAEGDAMMMFQFCAEQVQNYYFDR